MLVSWRYLNILCMIFFAPFSSVHPKAILKIHCSVTGWWEENIIYLVFTPKLGEIIPNFDEHIFENRLGNNPPTSSNFFDDSLLDFLLFLP